MTTPEPTHSVTVLFAQLQAPDPTVRDHAARLLLDRYTDDILGLIRRSLAARYSGRVGADDVMQESWVSAIAGLQDGRFQLESRTEFHSLLVTIALNKVRSRVRFENADKRDVHRERRTGTAGAYGSPDAEPPDLQADDPGPAQLAASGEAVAEMLAALPDDLRPVAVLLAQGYTQAEIATVLGVVLRTVERRLARVRELWAPYVDGTSDG
ncbi:RNA polymerase sigma factor [Fimbriiglobus ruber]|uniref:RNA polymerase sigma-70 ECF-like HTH domain-containing protein n=1 Tax=Fimbriiglobus ruber TaxID=1908690 RepID=A0A225DHA9_9BACT|nr:RNA polymerase sigma factor [Fimbriiglobus ruber]OWK40383.1 hypothetical protein FRUB_05302 [Fimbriiglobus ruber]